MKVRMATIAVFATVVSGASIRSRESQFSPVAVALISCSAILIVLALHEIVRTLTYRRLGVRVRGLDLALFGGSAQVVDSSNSPLRESIAGLTGLVLLTPIAASALILEHSYETRFKLHDMLGPIAFGIAAFTVIQAMPALPLDGGRILRGLVWHLTDDPVKGSRGAAIYGHFIAAGLIGLGTALVTFPGPNAFWGFGALAAGLQIVTASAKSVRDAICQREGSGLTLEAITLPWPRKVDGAESVDRAVDALIAEGGKTPLLVIDGPTPLGTLRMTDLRKVKRIYWEDHRVAEVATPISETPHFRMSDTAWDALSLLEESDKDYGVAIDDRGGVRLVNRETLMAHLFHRVVDNATAKPS